jgi:hypothetical protein
MKVGYLAKPKSHWDENFKKKKQLIGMVLKVEENFYRHNDYFEDRITVGWTHGEVTQEPKTYLDFIRT